MSPLAERRLPTRLIRLALTLIAALTAVTAWLPSGPAQAAPGHARLPAVTQGRAAHPRTIVTFAWGGGLADQMPSLRMFSKYGMHATYFIPSGLVCLLGQAQCQKSSPYLTLPDIQEIAGYGNEIGGLSVTHQQLTTMPVAEAKREVCDDRLNLFRWGFRPTDFAYPFALETPAVEALTRACGYNAGLGTGDLRGAGLCLTCAWAETIPPANPFNVRTPVEVNSVNTVWVPRTYESIVTGAQRRGGGWVIFTLHDICKTNCPLGTSPAILSAVLAWLHGQERHNVAVETMSQVIGGPVRSAVAGPAPRALPPPGVNNADLAASQGNAPACFQKVSYGGTTASLSYQPGGGPHGAAAATVRITRAGAGDAELLQTMDLGLCSPSVSQGDRYTAGMWYKSSLQARIAVYRRTSVGSWVYWTASPAFPASASWRQAAWTTPATPPGTTALSFGLATGGLGAISTTNYTLKLAKTYKELILLGVLAFVLLAAGLIARGHYRYARYLRSEAAEAAELEAETAQPQEWPPGAQPAQPQPQPARVEAPPARPEAKPARAEDATVVMTEAKPARAEDATVVMTEAKPARAEDATVIMTEAKPARAEDATVIMKVPEDATLVMKVVNPAGSRRAAED